MEHTFDTEYLVRTLNSKILECTNLLENAKFHLKGKPGSNRLYSRIESEKKFLMKLMKTPDKIKDEHIRSTNLTHLSSVVNCVAQTQNVKEVLKAVTFLDEECNYSRQVIIDVVADQGSTWIKVVARNPQSLYLTSLGASGYGKRSLVHQVKDFVKCAKLNPFMYQTPEIKVWFAAGVASKLKKTLKKIKVESIGNCIEIEQCHPYDSSSSDTCSEVEEESSNEPTAGESENSLRATDVNDALLANLNCDLFNIALGKNRNLLSLSKIPQNAVLNLDVSTMIAYVSSLTNGNCQYNFNEAILTDQASRERISPVKPILDELFNDRNLVCCQMAYHDFQEILSTVGGKMERERAEELLSKVTIVSDQPSEKANMLNISSKVKSRSRIIFGTGDTLKAITITANQGFLRASEGQGANFVCFLHESRALTELKEPSAVLIQT